MERLVRNGVVFLALAAATATVLGSPTETHRVVSDFHESVELIASFPYMTGFVHVDSGLDLAADVLTEPPMVGPFCGSTKMKNYTFVMLSADDVGHQRAHYILGSMPGDLNDTAQGVVKLSYSSPKSAGGQDVKIIMVLLEMGQHIPRFLPDEIGPPFNCTSNSGNTLHPDPSCQGPDDAAWPQCSPVQYAPDPACIAWAKLPTPDHRNGFNIETFATTNNLTIVDVKWFTIASSTTAAVSGRAGTGTGKGKIASTANFIAVRPPHPAGQRAVHPEEIKETRMPKSWSQARPAQCKRLQQTSKPVGV